MMKKEYDGESFKLEDKGLLSFIPPEKHTRYTTTNTVLCAITQSPECSIKLIRRVSAALWEPIEEKNIPLPRTNKHSVVGYSKAIL